ncbi:MAG: DUF1311 domain-containing protein [Anaerolineae bacterium]|nr:DUF1311 domain-containing protein [Anaerolineae bacterium]
MKKCKKVLEGLCVISLLIFTSSCQHPIETVNQLPASTAETPKSSGAELHATTKTNTIIAKATPIPPMIGSEMYSPDEIYAHYEEFLQAKPLEECWAKAMTQQAMNQCASLQKEQSYIKITEFLAESVFQTALMAEQQKSLTQVQIEWESFRQKDCEWVSGLYEQGSIGPMNYRLCLDMHNRQRLQQLLSSMMSWTGR